MRYLLDTNAVVDLLRPRNGRILRRIQSHDPSDIGLSSIALHELYYGAFKSSRQERGLALVDALRFEVLEFDGDDSRHAGEIRATLAKQGTPIGPYDVLIAGQARARDLTLVTANVSEFQRVHGLSVEDWTDLSPPDRIPPITNG
jgi:tRNA(fMet)-specific endonuclease VapC